MCAKGFPSEFHPVIRLSGSRQLEEETQTQQTDRQTIWPTNWPTNGPTTVRGIGRSEYRQVDRASEK